jgi:hypothetical protein
MGTVLHFRTIRLQSRGVKHRAGGVHPRSTTTPRGGDGYALAFQSSTCSVHYLLLLSPSITACPPARPTGHPSSPRPVGPRMLLLDPKP